MSSNTAHKWRFGSRPKLSSKHSILCVDEDEGLLRLRKASLEDAGYAVLIATTGARALELLTDSPVCLVLSGHMVRATTGNALAAEMKRIKPDVPVILFSGNIPLQLANIDVYVNKGESTEEFLKIVRGVIERYCS